MEQQSGQSALLEPRVRIPNEPKTFYAKKEMPEEGMDSFVERLDKQVHSWIGEQTEHGQPIKIETYFDTRDYAPDPIGEGRHLEGVVRNVLYHSILPRQY